MNITQQAISQLEKKGSINKEEAERLTKLAGGFLSMLGNGFKATNKALIDSGPAIQKYFGIPVAIASAIAAKDLIYNPIAEKVKINNAFKQMQDKVPQLQGQDPEKIKDYFNVVRTFSPKSATNPLVAGALVNKMMEFNGVDHKLVQDLTSIQQNVHDKNSITSLIGGAMSTVTGSPYKSQEFAGDVPMRFDDEPRIGGQSMWGDND